MSGRLVGEVVEWLLTPAAKSLGLTSAERTVLLVVAERAHEDSRVMLRHRVDRESLFERIRGALDVSEKSLGNIFGRLAKRNLEVRIPIGADRRGYPMFAANGHSTAFRLPEFPASITLPPAQSSIDEWTFPVDNQADQPVDNTVQEDTKVHQPMELHAGRSIRRWTFEGERSIDGWTLSTSKEDPSKRSPSTPVVPISQPDVENRPAVHREPSAQDQKFRQPPILLAVPDPDPREYGAARDRLALLPDYGQAAMAAARAELPTGTPLAQLVIHAADLAWRTA